MKSKFTIWGKLLSLKKLFNQEVKELHNNINKIDATVYSEQNEQKVYSYSTTEEITTWLRPPSKEAASLLTTSDHHITLAHIQFPMQSQESYIPIYMYNNGYNVHCKVTSIPKLILKAGGISEMCLAKTKSILAKFELHISWYIPRSTNKRENGFYKVFGINTASWHFKTP